MNNKLLAKLNKLTVLAKESNNILSRTTIKNEIWKNKDLQTEYQLNTAK